jgi:hypothetical protein
VCLLLSPLPLFAFHSLPLSTSSLSLPLSTFDPSHLSLNLSSHCTLRLLLQPLLPVPSQESWLLPPSDMTPGQRALLCSLPEHLIGTTHTQLCTSLILDVGHFISFLFFPSFPVSIVPLNSPVPHLILTNPPLLLPSRPPCYLLPLPLSLHALHCTALHCTLYTALHCTARSTLHCTALHALHCTALHCTLYTALHALHCTARCTLHYVLRGYNDDAAVRCQD